MCLPIPLLRCRRSGHHPMPNPACGTPFCQQTAGSTCGGHLPDHGLFGDEDSVAAQQVLFQIRL
jgi:hypothetical protein